VAARNFKGLLRVLVLASFFLGVGPAAATAASISGHITAEGGGPIAGAQVCPTPEPYTFETECVSTAADGFYVLNGLRPTSYHLRFSTPSWALNYVAEWYDDSKTFPGNLITVAGAGEARTGIDAELEPGGVMKGTLTDALSGDPAGGVWVWIDAFGSGPYGIGFRAQPDGTFEANDIPTGQYRVFFDGESDVNYLRRYYKDGDNYASATAVPVVAGSVASGIDQSLYPGAQIFGHVSNVETGGDLYGVRVCAVKGPESAEWCAKTDFEGDYAIRSLPADAYFVEFGAEYGPFGRTVGEWWEHAFSFDEADPIEIAPPETRTGIDGALPWYFEEERPQPETGKEETEASPPPPVASAPTSPEPRLRKCKKGFHRKLVKGKKRCVRKHRPHRSHRR
jgi:hypothetical protein